MNHRINPCKPFLLILLLISFSSLLKGQDYEEAVNLYNSGRYAESLTEFEKCLPVYIQQYGQCDTSHVTRILFFSAVCHYYGGAPEKGLQLLIKADSIYKELNATDKDYPSILNGMGGMYSYLGKYNESLECHEKAAQLLIEQNQKNTDIYSTTINNIGLVHRNRGDYQNALKYFTRAKTSFEEINKTNTANYCITLRNIGNIYKILDNNTEALKYFNTGLSILDSIGLSNRSIYINMRLSTIDVYGDERKYSTAINEGLKLLELVKKPEINNKLKEGELCYKIGIAYSEIFDLQLAIEYLQKAKEIYIQQEMIGSTVLADIYYRISDYYYNNQDYNLAHEYISAAIHILENLEVSESNYHYLTYQFHTGQIEIAKGITEEGLNRMISTLDFIDINENENLSIALNMMVTIADEYLTQNKPDKSREYLEKALHYTQSHHESYHHEDIIKLMLLCSRVDQQMVTNKELSDGIKHYSNSLISILFSETYETKHCQMLKNESFIRQLNGLLFEYNSDNAICAEILHTVETIKSLLQFRIISNQSLIDNISTQKLFDEYVELRKKLVKYSSLNNFMEDDQTLEYQNQLTRIELELADKHVDNTILSTVKQNSFNQLKNRLKNNEAVISLFTYSEDHEIHYGAILTRSNTNNPVAIKLVSKEALKNIRNVAIDNANAQSFLDEADDQGIVLNLYKNKDLYNALWEPIAPYLDDIDHIYISPTDELHTIAFDALTPGGNQYINDLFHIEYITSTTQMLASSSPLYYSNNTSAVIFGEMDYNLNQFNQPADLPLFASNNTEVRSSNNNNWNSLGKNTEIEDVAKLIAKHGGVSKIFKINDAIEDNFLALDGNAPEIIHLSTHACYNSLIKYKSNITDSIWYQSSPNPMLRSFLVMSGANNEELLRKNNLNDGKLTAYEISNLDLSDTRLAVLAACETGLGDVGDFEGVQGLRTAFKIAGVDYLLVSQWSVPNHQTTELMTHFYDQWINNKLEVRDAFRASQRIMRNKYPDNPYFWAGFQLIY